jgi:hypothetical protein
MFLYIVNADGAIFSLKGKSNEVLAALFFLNKSNNSCYFQQTLVEEFKVTEL